MKQENTFENEDNSKILVKVETGTPWFKKILGLLAAICGAIIAWLFYSDKNIDKLEQEIAEKKKKDKELKEKEDAIQQNIAVLKTQAEQASRKVEQKQEAFSEIVVETKEESKKFDEAVKDIRASANDTDANIDWVKQRFGGEITIND